MSLINNIEKALALLNFWNSLVLLIYAFICIFLNQFFISIFCLMLSAISFFTGALTIIKIIDNRGLYK
jgi:hypothetical protein